MKNLFFSQLFGLCFLSVNAQPAIQWQRSFGGSFFESQPYCKVAPDSSYIVIGTSSSTDGDVTEFYGIYDFWILKLNKSGAIIWQKSLGGSDSDHCNDVAFTSDGGYLLIGDSKSDNGHVADNYGENDCWMVKLSADGSLEWSKNYGGSNTDWAGGVQKTPDGGYIIAGGTTSNDKDVSGNHGNLDGWIIKIDATGHLQWQKSLGGAFEDFFQDIIPTADGNFMVVGETSSNDGDVSHNYGQSDLWVVEISDTGDIIWENSYGGTDSDLGFSIRSCTGGYIIAGQTLSNDGQVSGNHGSFPDCWVIRIDELGNLIWEKAYGGTSNEAAWSIEPTKDGNFTVAGLSQSTDGQPTGNHGKQDCWVFKIDISGEILWQKTLGGSEDEMAFSAVQTPDGGYLITGQTWSNDGQLTGNHGFTDFWVVKLASDAKETSVFQPFIGTDLEISPTPASSFVQINAPGEKELALTIYDHSGKIIFEQSLVNGDRLDMASWESGLYRLLATGADGKIYSAKIIKQR